jgi:hypothetical protein
MGSLKTYQFKIVLLGHSNTYTFATSQKKEMVILKLDFEKASDKIEHEVILHILRHKGFPDKWTNWIKEILAIGTSAVLLNGVPRKVFHYRRGVRQGGPSFSLTFCACC